MTWPAYLALSRAELERRIERAVAGLASCRVCPRNCDVDRLVDQTTLCRAGRYARVSSWFSHFGEEDCLRGWNGSGISTLPRLPPPGFELESELSPETATRLPMVPGLIFSRGARTAT